MSAPSNRHELLFTCHMNAIYHESLQRYYSLWLGFASFFSIVFSSAAFFALADLMPGVLLESKTLILGSISFLIASVNAAVLSFGMPERLRQHSDLRRQWIDAIARTQRTDGSDRSQIAELQSLVAALNAIEPPAIKWRLDRAFVGASRVMGL